MVNTFQCKADFEETYTGARSLDESKALNLALPSFDQLLAVSKDKIPLE